MAEGATLQGKKILIVEDDVLIHNLLTDKMSLLRDKGVEVIAMLSASEAIEKVKEIVPDLILLDLVMEGMTGFEFLEHLRADPLVAKTPVVILSNLSSDTDKARAKSLGVLAYLVKADLSLDDVSKMSEEILTGRALSAPKSGDPVIKKTDDGYVIAL